MTRPRGVVSACVWDYDDGMQMLRFFWDEVVALDPAAAPRDERHMKLSREGQLGQLWRREGLAEVQERPITIRQTFASFADYWEPFSVAGTDRLRLRRKNALRPVPARALDTRASTLRKPGAGSAGRVPGAR